MNTILGNVVRYQHQKLTDLTEPAKIDIMWQAFRKLEPLQNQIIQHPDADIDILASGNIMITGMPDALLKQVSELLRS